MQRKVTMLAGILLLTIFTTLITREYDKRLCYLSPNNSISNPLNQAENQNIVYATFSSPKADFSFEYPNTWTFEEEQIANTAAWRFYSDSKKEENALIVYSPMLDATDFCSGSFSQRGIEKNPYQLNTFPTNDPETFVTYERCGKGYPSTYIYWQKGEYLATSQDIKDIQKINLMKFMAEADNTENTDIAQHIAQSIKVK